MIKSLQTCSQKTGVVRNHTRFGQELVKFGKLHIALILDTQGCGWLDGGCLIFAAGLHVWSDRKLDLMALYSPSGFADHAVASWTDKKSKQKLYLDADGLCTDKELLNRWALIERRTNVSIGEFDTEKSHIPYDEKLVEKIAIALLKTFGEFRPSLLNIDKAEVLISKPKSQKEVTPLTDNFTV